MHFGVRPLLHPTSVAPSHQLRRREKIGPFKHRSSKALTEAAEAIGLILLRTADPCDTCMTNMLDQLPTPSIDFGLWDLEIQAQPY